MENEFKKYEFEWAGRKLIVEVGEFAKQANGACMITYGESSVLSCVLPSAAFGRFLPLCRHPFRAEQPAGALRGREQIRGGDPHRGPGRDDEVLHRAVLRGDWRGGRSAAHRNNRLWVFDVSCVLVKWEPIANIVII